MIATHSAAPTPIRRLLPAALAAALALLADLPLTGQTIDWTARKGEPLIDGDALPGSGDTLRGKRALAVGGSGSVYVTGSSFNGSSYDYLTVAYDANGTELWARVKNGAANSDDLAYALAVDRTGTVYVTGYSYNGSNSDYLTVAYDASGTELWAKVKDGAANSEDLASALAVDDSGNVYVTGQSFNGSSYDYLTVAYDTNGVELWARWKDGLANSDDGAHALAVDVSGTVYVTGYSYNGSNSDYLTVAYDASGTELWAKAKNGAANSSDQAYALAVDGSGNVLVTGSSYNGSNEDYLTVAYDASGTELWAKAKNGTANGTDRAYALAVDGSRKVYVTGYSHNGSNTDYLTVAYDASGTELWAQDKNGAISAYDNAFALAVDGSGTVFVTGVSVNGPSYDYLTVAYGAGGTELWAKVKNGAANSTDQAFALAVGGSGTVYVTGQSHNGSNWDYLTVAYDASGTELWAQKEPPTRWPDEHPGNGDTLFGKRALAVEESGSVYVTGQSWNGSTSDLLTVAYDASGSELWARVKDGSANSYDYAYAVAVAGSGNVYVTGFTINGSPSDYLTVAYDESGTELWALVKDGAANSWDYAHSLAVDASGIVYVTGESDNGANTDYLTVAYDASGTELWARVKNGAANSSDYAQALAVGGSGSVYVAGHSWNGSDHDYLTVAYDTNGIELWAKVKDGGPGSDDLVDALAVDGSGNVYVTGRWWGGANEDYLTVAYDTNGMELWARGKDGLANSDDGAHALAVDGSGNVYVTGQSFNGANWDYLTVAYDASGTELWARMKNGAANGDDIAYALAVDGSGTVYVTGRSSNGSNDDYLTVAYDASGTELWALPIDEGGDDQAYTIAVDAASGVIVSGWSIGGARDFLTVRIAATVDTTAPADPTIVSTSPLSSTWTNDNTVQVTWSGAADDPGGSGLAGYSTEWNHSAVSTPDAVVDVPHGADPHSTTSAALVPDGNDWYFHLRTCDLAGNCTATVHAGPFWIDTAPPTGLAVTSTSHAVSSWSNDNGIDFTLSGATDPNGIVGYSVVLDQLAATDPDGIPDQAGPTFTGTASPDGSSWYLHARACDPAGNCGGAVHSGPYWIDATAPSGPGSVTSASHGDGQPKGDDTVDIAWGASTDALSGVALYRYGFTNSATPPACGSLATTTATLAGASGNLSDGTWYAHVCAVDHAGNEGAVATGGPYLVDLSPPQVVNVDSVASAGGSLEQGEATNVAITELLLAFDEAMDATLAGTPASYLLVEAGLNGTIETTGCAVGGDDVAVAIDTASYAAGTATLGVNGGAALPDGRYALAACAALQDVAGNALDGDGDTAGGDDFLRAFSVDTAAPAVLATRIADDGQPLTGGLQTNATVTGIEVEFDERMSDPPGDGGAGDVDSPASYRLVFDLAGAFETESCGDGDSGDDADVAIDSVAWQDATRRATVALNGGSALADGGYRFFACGTLADRAGNPLAAELPVDFRIDTQAPALPTILTSTTHAPFAWSGLATLGMLWSGAVDEPAGSGLSHYALALDVVPASVPDGVWILAHGSDPHEVASGPLASGTWYFHLVACDAAGNCAGPRHAGPYLVDFAGPEPPLVVVSPSHDGGPSQDATIEVAWTPAIDDASGLAGYGWIFAASSSWACDEVEDGDESASTATSPPLGEGDWYFHLCARDNAGNWGAAGSYGPWAIDTTAPQVASLDSVPEAGLGGGAPPPVEVALTQLLVGFSEGMAESGAGAVVDVANWRLVEAGGDAVIDTVACGPLAGDDVAAPLAAVQFDAGTHLAALAVGSGAGLPVGSYRLLACPGLTDAAGNALATAPWTSDFSVAVEPLAANPNFDADLSAWMVTGPVPAELGWLAEDAEAKPFSGAARLDTAAGAGAFWYLETCVVLPAEGDYELSSVARIGSAEPGAPAARVFLTWVDTPTCFGGFTELGDSGVLTGDSGGAWEPLAIPPVAAPPGSGSVWISYVVQGGAASSYTVDFDRVLFAPAHGLFSDDFETGAPCRWAGVVGGPACP